MRQLGNRQTHTQPWAETLSSTSASQQRQLKSSWTKTLVHEQICFTKAKLLLHFAFFCYFPHLLTVLKIKSQTTVKTRDVTRWKRAHTSSEPVGCPQASVLLPWQRCGELQEGWEAECDPAGSTSPAAMSYPWTDHGRQLDLQEIRFTSINMSSSF